MRPVKQKYNASGKQIAWERTGHTTSFAGTSPVVFLQNVVRSYIEWSMAGLRMKQGVRGAWDGGMDKEQPDNVRSRRHSVPGNVDPFSNYSACQPK